jgi:hypothetical protein
MVRVRQDDGRAGVGEVTGRDRLDGRLGADRHKDRSLYHAMGRLARPGASAAVGGLERELER